MYATLISFDFDASSARELSALDDRAAHLGRRRVAVRVARRDSLRRAEPVGRPPRVRDEHFGERGARGGGLVDDASGEARRGDGGDDVGGARDAR